MSQNNGGGAIGALGVLIVAGYILFWIAVGISLAVYAVLSFCALIITLICLLAWNRPRRFFHLGIVPHQARAILAFGVVGAILLPAFGLYVEWLFETRLPSSAWFHLILGGYAVGTRYIWAGETFSAAQVERHYIDLVPEVLPPQPLALPAPERPFEYASWDDEIGFGYDPHSERCQGCALKPDPKALVFRR